MIRKVMMDISVPQMTGGPPASGVEECQCPDGYSGLSCEKCDTGYYRDESDVSSGPLGACKPCPCNDNQESCTKKHPSEPKIINPFSNPIPNPFGKPEDNPKVQDDEVVCVCKQGWTGKFCDSRGKF